MRNRSVVIGHGAAPILVLAFLIGCTSAAPNGTVANDPPTLLAIGLASSFCAAQAACCGVAGAGTDGGAAGATSCTADAGMPDGGASDCMARATLSAEQQLALVETAFTEGLLTVDPTVSAACVQAYQNVGCPAVAGKTEPDVQAALDNPVCAKLFTGYIPINNRCDMTAECETNTFCLAQGTGQNVTSITGSGTLGTCFPYQMMGAACNTTDDCLPPLACSATTLTCE